ncbi:hypothetical protein [Jeotgalibacillus proteolyticus]|nr:hypothetical protein [Jeotgalibacillus proteolyticus]
MGDAASFIVNMLYWIGIAVILFIIFSLSFLLKTKSSSKEKKHPADKRKR